MDEFGAGDDEEDEIDGVERLMGRDEMKKAASTMLDKATAKKKGKKGKGAAAAAPPGKGATGGRAALQ